MAEFVMAYGSRFGSDGVDAEPSLLGSVEYGDPVIVGLW
jgi:hypothetical protein